MLRDAAQRLVETARDEAAGPDQLNTAAQALFDAARRAPPEELREALGVLAGAFHLPDARRAGFVATVCGALVEHGCDPSPMVGPLLERLQALLPACADFADACQAESAPADPEEEPGAPFEAARERLAPRMPAEAAAWAALEYFWRPAVAVFSASPPARAAARGLREPAAKIADHHEGGHWLRLLLAVLHDEPLLVIEPARQLGLAGRMSGVADNFQLHVLLMDVFPRTGLFARRRVPRRVADVARGRGPQQLEDLVTGAWNLYTWQAVRPDLTLPGRGDLPTHWVWGEGTPEDIPVFEGHRVVLLGPPSYVRTWGAQRLFAHLSADIASIRKLSRDEVGDWLRRMAAAAGAA